MTRDMGRRTFLGATAGTAWTLAAFGAGEPQRDVVRVGVIGTGNRGCSLLRNILRMKDVRVPVICDIDTEAAARAVALVEKAGQPTPEAYTRNETAYRDLLARDDLDAVLIAAYWQWHTPMSVDAMKAGKYVGVEMNAALTFEDCWALVDTSEETGVPCMLLENWSFRRDNLALLQMKRQGLFGDIVHCHCAHSHECISGWFFDKDGNDRWPAEFLVKYNRDQYPTHSVGPVLSWMDINCGDAFATITSTATDSKAINAYFARTFGPEHPGAKRHYAQGDIVTSVVRTHGGKTLVINYDMQLPRPYDNRWMLQGTLGVYDESRQSLYLEGRSPEHHQWEPYGPYQAEFDHPWWKQLAAETGSAGHGGTDYLELSLFIKAVREKTQTPLDVYDSATMSSLVPLSEASIQQGSAPVACPDYMRGRWKTRKPVFGVV